MSKKYRNETFAAIHETMEALHEVGAIDKQTMREFDDSCTTPVLPMPPERGYGEANSRSIAETSKHKVNGESGKRSNS
jgi:hypothetical protein